YQQVASQPLLFARLSTDVRTVVIFDEIHHAGEDYHWGEQLRLAFSRAAHRLLLSGTWDRSDGTGVAFLTPETPRFLYTYTQAMDDGLCRKPGMQTFEGHLWWLDERQEKQEAHFGATLSQRDQRRRLISA